MADEGTTTKHTGDDDSSGVHRLRDIVVEEVSLVDRAANKRRFLLVKRSSQMSDDGKSRDGTSQGGPTGGKKPRSKPDANANKSRTRVMRAAPEDDDEEDEDDDGGKSRTTESEDEEDDDEDDETEKTRRSTESRDEEDEETEKEENDENDNDEAKRGQGRPPAKRPDRAGAPGKVWGDRTGKADEGALVLPASLKSAVLRALAQALERLMAIANRVKEADAAEDGAEAGVPDDLTSELEDIGELLEDIGEQLANPGETSDDTTSDAAKGRAAKTDLSKAGRRMAKDRLERFQKALELLAAVLKELTLEKPAPSTRAAGKPVGKREPPNVGELITSVQELTQVVKQQGEQLGRLQKTRATSNAIPVDGTSRRRELQDVSWPLDMNRPISRDRVDKATSFYED
jgi:hypothetical protein